MCNHSLSTWAVCMMVARLDLMIHGMALQLLPQVAIYSRHTTGPDAQVLLMCSGATCQDEVLRRRFWTASQAHVSAREPFHQS